MPMAAWNNHRMCGAHPLSEMSGLFCPDHPQGVAAGTPPGVFADDNTSKWMHACAMLSVLQERQSLLQVAVRAACLYRLRP